MTFSSIRRALVAGTLAALAAPLAHSQPATYPSRPIRLIVTFVPGGGADILARYLAQALTTALGQTVIVSGQGGVLHLAAAWYADAAGIQMNHIPYKGGGAALNDLLAHQVDAYFAATASALPMVKAGQLRPLALTGTKRIAALPQVPTRPRPIVP